jgi:hypothetical protein
MSGDSAPCGRDQESAEGRPWRARGGLLYRPLVDGGLLYDAGQERVHHLNATAALVWEQCGRGARLCELVERVSQVSDVDDARARADVQALLGQLASAGLVHQ